MKFRDLASDSSNWIFAFSQAFAGGLHYLFQVYAARSLTIGEFGEWSAWFAQFSVSLFLAMWLQSLMTIRRSPGLYVSARVAYLTAGALVAGTIAAVMISQQASTVLGWVWMAIFSAFTGIALAQRRLLLVAGTGALMAVSKFVVAGLYPDESGFVYAVLLAGLLPTIVFLGFFKPMAAFVPSIWGVGDGGSQVPEGHKDHRGNLVTSALVFSLLTALIPQLDLVTAQTILTSDQLGGFAKVALIYKAIFFLLMILAQVLLTYQVRGSKIQLPIWMSIGGFLGGAVLVAGASRFMSISMVPTDWITGSLLHIVSLTAVFFAAQQRAAHQQWRWPALWSALLVTEHLLVRWGKVPMLTYLGMGFLLETISLIFFIFAVRFRRIYALGS